MESLKNYNINKQKDPTKLFAYFMGYTVYPMHVSHASIWWIFIQRLAGLILGLHPANERRRYKVTPSLIGWVQT